jgi:hypothetical protein
VKIAGWRGDWKNGMPTTPSPLRASPSSRLTVAMASGSCLPPSRIYGVTEINPQSLDTGGFQELNEVMGVMIIPKVKQEIQSKAGCMEAAEAAPDRHPLHLTVVRHRPFTITTFTH